jgi:hypothetical protein
MAVDDRWPGQSAVAASENMDVIVKANRELEIRGVLAEIEQ